jgi:hypothetical protein
VKNQLECLKGGRIGYSVGAGKKGVQGLLDLVKNKFGKKSITTADKVARPESAITRDLFKRMSKKLKNKLPKKGEFIEDGETPDYEYYAELLNDAEDSRGFNVQGDETIEVLEDRLKQLKDEEAYYYGQYKAGKLDPEPGEINRSRLTFLKNKSEEAEMSREGGRIGFAAGGIDKVRRAFLKLLGAGAGATAATKTGLFGLLKGKQEAKIATKAAEQVVQRNEPPAYVFDLVKIIRAKGKDITKSAQTIERETVKTYKGVDLYETPDGFRIRAEGKSAQEGGKEIDLMYSQMDEIKDEGLETQKSFTVTDYEEATVRPDAEGKMKDVDFYVDEADHKELQKIVDEEKNKFKSGGLAYMLGE